MNRAHGADISSRARWTSLGRVVVRAETQRRCGGQTTHPSVHDAPALIGKCPRLWDIGEVSGIGVEETSQAIGVNRNAPNSGRRGNVEAVAALAGE